ncbi:MAG: hypothetical protein LC667_10495 [Thioalkalivibrio sp.]|nr:hypothetical protein [Thioalkalivibrio sp.]
MKATEYSKHLWNRLSGDQTYEVTTDSFSDPFMMLDDQETEDLLFLYLQTRGWYVVPNSRKSDTMSFEYMLVKPTTHEKAWVQVKTGRQPLNRDHYRHYPHQVVLFQPNALYEGADAANVTCVSSTDVLRFLREARDWLPDALVAKVELANATEVVNT